MLNLKDNILKEDNLVSFANLDTFTTMESIAHIKKIDAEGNIYVDKLAVLYKIPDEKTGNPTLQLVPSFLISRTTNNGFSENDKTCSYMLNYNKFDIIGLVKDKLVIDKFNDIFSAIIHK